MELKLAPRFWRVGKYDKEGEKRRNSKCYYSVVHQPAAPASCGSLLGMQTLRLPLTDPLIRNTQLNRMPR